MNTIKFICVWLLAANCGLGPAWAQPNTPPKAEQELEIDSESGIFNGTTYRMIYIGHVIVTDHAKATLTCERLTVDLPSGGGNPTNILAETNVVVDALDAKGQTNHLTAARATYSYSVVGAVTNEIVVFTGKNPMPRLENPKSTVVADPMVFDVVKKTFEFPGHVEMHLKQTSTGTNSQFNFLK